MGSCLLGEAGQPLKGTVVLLNRKTGTGMGKSEPAGGKHGTAAPPCGPPCGAVTFKYYGGGVPLETEKVLGKEAHRAEPLE